MSAHISGHGQQLAYQATASPVVEVLLRLGYVVRGLVYGVIGLLALKVALGAGGKITDAQGAIVAINESPLGNILLWVVLAGLLGYGLWGLIRAALDPIHQGATARSIATRVGYVISGVSYLLLALPTYALITAKGTRAHSGAQTAQAQEITAMLLAKPWGAVAISLAGLIIVGVGLSHIYHAFRRDFDPQFQPNQLNQSQRRTMIQVARFGIAARGFTFALIGFFLLLAARFHDPHQARGLDGVLYQVLQQPAGSVLLSIVALGLIAFGIYSALGGAWLRFNRPAGAGVGRR